MPTPKKGPRLGGSPAHQRLILSNLATALFEHGRITTTETRARTLRPVAEKLITKARTGTLHARRLAGRHVAKRAAADKLFHELGPKFAARKGGYTRITKIGNRKGDNAPMAVIEVVSESVEESRKLKAKGKIMTISGGYEIARPIEYAENGTYQRYSGYDPLSTAASDVLTSVKFELRQIALHVTASGRELRMNSGREQIIDLSAARVRNAW